MAFSLRVWCRQRDDCFAVLVSLPSIEGAEIKALIEAAPTGKSLGFVAGDWDLYRASAVGEKHGGPLPFNHPFTPAAGSTVNVWVEPKAGAAAAGETFWGGVAGGGRGVSWQRTRARALGAPCCLAACPALPS